MPRSVMSTNVTSTFAMGAFVLASNTSPRTDAVGDPWPTACAGNNKPSVKTNKIAIDHLRERRCSETSTLSYSDTLHSQMFHDLVRVRVPPSGRLHRIDLVNQPTAGNARGSKGPILGIESPELLCCRHLHPTELRPPPVERLLADPMLPTQPLVLGRGLLDALDRHRVASACARLAPPLRGVAPVKIIPAGRLASRPSAPVATLSETATVPTVTQMRMTTPAITTQRNRYTGDGLDCNAIVI